MDGSSGDAISSLAASILSMADNLPPEDPKLEETLKIIELKQEMPNNKIMLFSTFRHTLAYLKKKLTELGYRVEQVDGGVKDEQRYAFKARFELPKEDPDSIDILLFTEVGSEGLDYQFCDMMINYDLPWNPMRIEQRIGRIDRRGQKSEAVNIYNVITENTIDAEIYYRCLMRIGILKTVLVNVKKSWVKLQRELKVLFLTLPLPMTSESVSWSRLLTMKSVNCKKSLVLKRKKRNCSAST